MNSIDENIKWTTEWEVFTHTPGEMRWRRLILEQSEHWPSWISGMWLTRMALLKELTSVLNDDTSDDARETKTETTHKKPTIKKSQ